MKLEVRQMRIHLLILELLVRRLLWKGIKCLLSLWRNISCLISFALSLICIWTLFWISLHWFSLWFRRFSWIFIHCWL